MTKAAKVNIVADNILLIRSELGLSQAKFGDLIGLNKTKVYNYENKVTEPKQIILDKIAQVAGIEATELSAKKLRPDDLNFKSIPSPDAINDQIKMLFEIAISLKAQNNIILRNQNNLLAKGQSKTKYLGIAKTTDEAVNEEAEKIKGLIFKF